MFVEQVVKEKQDLKALNWSKYRNSSGTAGSFLKSSSKNGNAKIYYKLSNYDSVNGVTGIECVNEIIVDRLLDILGVEHLHYRLIHASIIVDGKEIDTYLCASEDFKGINEDKNPLDTYFDMEHEANEDILNFCLKRWDLYIYTMFVVDFLILNRDRHGANVEVLRDRKKRQIRLSPLFDHGVSLLFNCHTEDEIESFDVLEDKRVNNYIGSKSTKENLESIPKDKMPQLNKLKQSDKSIVFKDLDGIIPQKLIDKTWDMIYKRWEQFESICN